MTLAETIQNVQLANERKLAQTARVAAPRLELTDEARRLLGGYISWCKARGVRHAPALPSTVALWVKSEHEAGVRPEIIAKTLDAIDALHGYSNVATPVPTPIVREELQRVLQIEAPRSWSKADKLKFMTMPADIREIISRRARQDEVALRRAQNELAEIRKANQQKEIATNVRQEKS
jgi:hypothetical protein